MCCCCKGRDIDVFAFGVTEEKRENIAARLDQSIKPQGTSKLRLAGCLLRTTGVGGFLQPLTV